MLLFFSASEECGLKPESFEMFLTRSRLQAQIRQLGHAKCYLLSLPGGTLGVNAGLLRSLWAVPAEIRGLVS